MTWVPKSRQAFVVFTKSRIHQIDNLIEAIENKNETEELRSKMASN
jgi:hypothetical protein